MATIVVVTGDLLFGSRIQQALLADRHQVTLSTEVDPTADLLVVDLPEMGDLSPLAGLSCPVLGYYSHVDPGPRNAALEIGIEVAVPRSKLVREMTDLVAGVLQGEAG